MRLKPPLFLDTLLPFSSSSSFFFLLSSFFVWLYVSQKHTYRGGWPWHSRAGRHGSDCVQYHVVQYHGQANRHPFAQSNEHPRHLHPLVLVEPYYHWTSAWPARLDLTWTSKTMWPCIVSSVWNYMWPADNVTMYCTFRVDYMWSANNTTMYCIFCVDYMWPADNVTMYLYLSCGLHVTNWQCDHVFVSFLWITCDRWTMWPCIVSFVWTTCHQQTMCVYLFASASNWNGSRMVDSWSVLLWESEASLNMDQTSHGF